MMRTQAGPHARLWVVLAIVAAGGAALAEEAQPIDLAQDAASVLRSRASGGGVRIDAINKIQDRLHDRRASAILRLERVVEAYPDDPKAPALMFQLAELLFEHQRAEHLARFEDLDAELEQDDLLADYGRAKAAYSALLAAHPDAPEAAGALYGLAYCLQEEGEGDAALVHYGKLVERFPKAGYAPEAYVRLGELLFDRNRLEEAAASYRAVLDWPASSLYEEALYKLGWTYYRLSRYADAISVFTYLIDDAGAGQQPDGMAGEAKSYIAISFSEFGGVEGLQSYLQDIGDRPYGAELLLSLGGLLRGEGEFDAAERAFRGFVESYGDHQEAPRAQRELVEVLELQEKESAALAAQARFSSLFGPGTTWADAWRAAEQAADVRQSAEDFHYASAAGVHAEARESGDSEGLRRAVDLYASFFERYPESQRLLQVAMQRADAWIDLEQPLVASDYFVEAAEIAAQSPESAQLAADALYRAILAADAAGAAADSIALGRMSVAIERLSAEHPRDERVPSVWMRRAELHFDAARYTKAALDFVRVAGMDAPPELIGRATEMAARSHFEAKQYGEAEAWAARLGDDAEASALRVAAAYRQAELLRDAQDWSAAATEFLRVVALDPADSGAAAALYDAASAWLGGEDPTAAARDFERLATDYPESELATDALRQAAVLHEAKGDHLRAATLLSELASRAADSAMGDDASYYAARYWLDAGESARALVAFTAYREHYADDPERNIDARIQEIRLLEATDADRMRRLAALGALLDAAETYRARGAEIAPAILAEAEFKRTELDLPTYREATIKPPLDQSTRRKEALMNQLLDGYARTSEHLAARWSIRSLVRMGEVLEEFHRGLVQAPVPDDLSEVEAALYLMELEDYAAPYGDQAVESYVAAIDMAIETGLDEPLVAVGKARAQAFRPELELAALPGEELAAAPPRLAASAALRLPDLTLPTAPQDPADSGPWLPRLALGSGARWTLAGAGAAGGVGCALLAAQGSNTGVVLALGAASGSALAAAIWGGSQDDGQLDDKSHKNYSPNRSTDDLELKGPRVELTADPTNRAAQLLLSLPLP